MSLPAPTSPLAPLYLLDTNILVHYIRRDALQQRIEAIYQLLLTPTIPLISYATEAEIRSLARQWNWGRAMLDQLGFILATFRRVPLDSPGILEAYVDIDAFSVTAGREMGKNDVWIAATARVTTAILLTTDKDFDHLDPSFLTRIWIDPTEGSDVR